MSRRTETAYKAQSLGELAQRKVYLERDPQRKLDLWASALTYYAKAQLYAQMAKTSLEKASTGMP